MARVKPFREIIEVVQDLSRSQSDDKRRIRGIVNRKYLYDIPRIDEWSFLKATSAISCLAEYTTGVVTVTTGGTAVGFGSGAVMDSSMTGRRIKFDGNDNIYDITFTKADSCTISPPLSGTANVGSGGYTIFKNIYSLPTDFDRFLINGGLLFYSAGQPRQIPEKMDDDFIAEFNVNPTSQPDICRLIGYDTAGNRQVEISPPPSVAYAFQNEYLKTLSPMSETTGGTVITITDSTVITGTGTFFTLANTGDYFRVDNYGIGPDSKWYQIQAIVSDSDLTLSKNFIEGTGGASTKYVISSAPLYPYGMQDALIYGALEEIYPDQNDPNFILYHVKYAQVLSSNKILTANRMSKDSVELIAEDYDYRR